MWGVNGHPLVSYPGVSFAEQLDAVRDLGMTSYRVDVPDTGYIAALQELVGQAHARGITILPVVTPGFDLEKESAESLEKAAYGLAFALVSSFKGQIPVWELGNEMENYAIIQPCEMQDDGKQYSCSFGPAGGRSPLEYFGPRWKKVSAVLKGLTRGAHAADPSVKRAVGTAGWGHIGAFERMKADGIDWDISVWHMFGEGPEWAFKELAAYKKPIWVTEFNNPYGSQKSKEEQVQGLMRTMSQLTQLQKDYDVEAAHIYELMDEPYWKGFEAHMGLIGMTKDGKNKWKAAEKKPAYLAVKERLSHGDARPPREIAIRRECEMAPAADGETLASNDVITYAYCLVLGREPDGAGASSYASSMAGGMTVGELLIDMLNSDEFSSLYDVPQLTKSEYVTLMHRLLLGTDPTEAALKKAVADLEGNKALADLQRELIQSEAFRSAHPSLSDKSKSAAVTTGTTTGSLGKPQVHRNCDYSTLHRPLEFERGQVIYSYCLVLGRWPDMLGLKQWTAERRNGLGLEDFLSRVLQSDEFTNKYRTDELDNAGFTTLLYRLLLNRDPNDKELNSCVSSLDSGKTSRAQLGESIFASTEFHQKQEALYTATMPKKLGAQAPQ